MCSKWSRRTAAGASLRAFPEPSDLSPQTWSCNRVSPTVRRILPFTAFALLSACTQVEFQSPPSLPLLDCDPLLIGDWQVVDPRSEPNSFEFIYLRVTEGCAQWLGIEVDMRPGDEPKLKVEDLKDEMSLGFARAGEQRYIASMARQKPDPEPPLASDDQPTGYVLAAYEADGDGWLFRLIEPSAVAHRIIDDEIPGWLEKRDRRADGRRDAMAKHYTVYVFGDADSISAVLQTHDLLGAPWLHLVPVDAATSTFMDEWIDRPPHETAEPVENEED